VINMSDMGIATSSPMNGTSLYGTHILLSVSSM
jgi:hypothetical protein